MIEEEKLRDYAHKLMFDMKKEEYQILQEEFHIMLKQMDLIGKIPHLKDVKPMTFPFRIDQERKLREDTVEEYLTVDEVLRNAKHQVSDQVKVPKVVE